MNKSPFREIKAKLRTDVHYWNLGVILLLAFLSVFVFLLIVVGAFYLVLPLTPEDAGLAFLGYLFLAVLISLLLTIVLILTLGFIFLRGKKGGYIILLILLLIIVLANGFVLMYVDGNVLNIVEEPQSVEYWRERNQDLYESERIYQE